MELRRRAGASNLNAWKDGKRVLTTLVRERMTRVGSRVSESSQVTLIPTLMPAHSSVAWRPAGSPLDLTDLVDTAELMTVLVAHNGPVERELTPARGRQVATAVKIDALAG